MHKIRKMASQPVCRVPCRLPYANHEAKELFGKNEFKGAITGNAKFLKTSLPVVREKTDEMHVTTNRQTESKSYRMDSMDGVWFKADSSGTEVAC